MIRAYSELYLDDAMRNLGEAFDFVYKVYHIELDDFLSMMINTSVAREFERGNPKYVSGLSGTELALEVLGKTGIALTHLEALTDYDRSPEYWAGWMVAYFQWFTGRTFRSIYEALSMQEVLRLYPTLHEVSEKRAVDGLNRVIRHKALPARLQFRRKSAQMTQWELSQASGVSLRTIQQYEQRSKDINKAAGATLRALAWALDCDIENLLEYDCHDIDE